MSQTIFSPSRPEVAIVGAGICGLGIGWRLAEAGARVTVYDRGEAGREASWAAAGMLAAQVETEPGEEALLTLTLESQRRWPAFAHAVATAGGVDLAYRDEGTLVVAVDRDDVEALRHTYEFQKGLGLDLAWLSGREARRREPHLSPKVAGGVLSPHDHQVDNRKLVSGLKAAFLAAGGTLREHTPVDALVCGAGRVAGVRCGESEHPAEVVVLAAGAWSYDLAGVPAVARPPVRPLKGQMLSLQMDPAAPVLDHVLWAPGIYLVPRRDGRLLLGATVEDRGFDRTLTAGGVFRLLEAAWEVLPQIEELPIAEMWVGFRPTSRDDAPILGPTAVDGLVLATGHHRNGVLLAPVTADAVARYVLDGTLDPAVRAFGIDRFAAVGASAAATAMVRG